MSDDERLAALFRDAASDADAPAPRFDHDDVVSASRRITARRRSAALAAAAVIGLAGLGAAVLLPIGGDSPASTAASPLDAPEAADAPYAARDDAGSGEAGSGEAGGAGGDAAAQAPAPPAAPGLVPLGPGAGPCADRQDPDLRRLVEQVLPEVADAAPAATTDVCLPGRDRYLALQVPGGVLTVSYLAPGSIPAVVQGALLADTASGGTLIVHSTADRAGFADRLPELVAFLAPRL